MSSGTATWCAGAAARSRRSRSVRSSRSDGACEASRASAPTWPTPPSSGSAASARLSPDTIRTQSRAVSFEEVRRLLAIAVFSLAATGSTLAGAGLVVAPHVDPPGTPAFHDHVLAAYRFPIFLMHLHQLYDRGQKFTMESPFAASLSAAMGLLIIAWPRLPRPTRRPTADISVPLISPALWSAPLLL